MRICNFNDNHRVFAPEINFHHERCEDRYKVVETIRYHASGKTGGHVYIGDITLPIIYNVLFPIISR